MIEGKVLIDPVTQQNHSDSLTNALGLSGLPSRITQAIKTAAARTGVDFSYLLKKATQESGLDPHAKAKGSSATGLFQFTNQTWLQMVKDHGSAYGLGNYADHISVDSNGRAHVTNTAFKQAILGLRQDPQISAEMAGELDKENFSSLKDKVGGKIGGTELYLAHFLGAGGASDFLNSMRTNPTAKASTILPEAAAANPSVFYNASGQPRSLSQIYQHFAQKFDGSSTYSTTLMANAQTKITTPSSYSYAMASTAYNGAVQASYTPPMTSSIKTDTPSMLASMVLAQIDMGKMDAISQASFSPNHNNKNTFTTLSAVG